MNCLISSHFATRSIWTLIARNTDFLRYVKFYLLCVSIISIYASLLHKQIKLGEGCAGQCSSMDEFVSQFGSQCSKRIAKSVIIRNPAGVNDLFGMLTTGDLSIKERKDFISSTNAEAFQVSSNCW